MAPVVLWPRHNERRQIVNPNTRSEGRAVPRRQEPGKSSSGLPQFGRDRTPLCLAHAHMVDQEGVTDVG